MNISQLIQDSAFNVEPVIDVFLCDVNECRLTIDVIHPALSPVIGDLSFAAIVNVDIDIDIDDRKLLLEELKSHVNSNVLKFCPHAETELSERFNSADSGLDADLALNHQEEFESPYSEEVNMQLTQKIIELFDQNKFEITYI